VSDLNLDGLTDAQLRLFAVRCARRVQHLMADPRSIAALDVAERHARGEATDEELAAARAAAWAAEDAWAAMDAASDETDAAWASAWGAAKAAAWTAAKSAAKAAAWASDAAWDVERAEQQKILDEIRETKP
jgi:hypothetical protein